MRSPKPQPKSKSKTKTASTPRAIPSVRHTNLGGCHPAFIRIPPLPRPVIEYLPINHPRGKDGGWGH